MSYICNLHDLFIEQGREIYDAERQQIDALNEIVGKIHSGELREAVNEHIAKTIIQKQRLENVFNLQHKLPCGEQNNAMKALICEMIEMINRSTRGEVMDAGIIASLQQLKHFEIAVYGTLCSLARKLKDEKDANNLHASLEEEKLFDKKLTKIAFEVNKKALSSLIL